MPSAADTAAVGNNPALKIERKALEVDMPERVQSEVKAIPNTGMRFQARRFSVLDEMRLQHLCRASTMDGGGNQYTRHKERNLKNIPQARSREESRGV